jgi:hypothetical protein
MKKSMKKLLISLSFFALALSQIHAQCSNGDCANGNGRFLHANGDRYLGEFKDSVSNGRGAYYFNNGDLYKGQFKKGERHGFGNMTWKSGDKYIGEYAHNQRHGDGTYYFADGRVKKGVFKDGVLVQEFSPPKIDPPTVATVTKIDSNNLVQRGGDPLSNKNTPTNAGSNSKKMKAVSGIVQGEARVALLFGNANYKETPLKNAGNDAQAMADELVKLGFEVWLYKDASKREMKEAIRDFSEYLRAQKAVGLFFYAGHGLQADGRNYLVPVDADIKGAQDIEFEAFDLSRLLVEMEFAENPMNIIILDACRDNPYKKEFGDRYKNYAGFTQIQNAPINSMVAFSTAPGATASDGTGQNGLYTQELLKNLASNGDKKLEDIFKLVRASVRKASAGKQIPWENSAIETDFYFKKGK